MGFAPERSPWTKRQTDARGIRYYDNSETRARQWMLPDDLLPPLTPDNTGMALPEWWKVRAPHSHIRMSVATDPSFYLPQDACGRLHARPAHAAESV